MTLDVITYNTKKTLGEGGANYLQIDLIPFPISTRYSNYRLLKCGIDKNNTFIFIKQ